MSDSNNQKERNDSVEKPLLNLHLNILFTNADKPECQLTVLKENIEKHITSIKSSRDFYRKSSFRVYIAAAILTALSTILLGLHFRGNNAEIIRRIVLVITILVSLINIYSAFYSFKDSWFANNTALNSLYQLQKDITIYETGNSKVDSKVVFLLYLRHQAIFDSLNNTWSQSRSEIK